LQEKKTQNSSQRTFTKKKVHQTDTKLSEEPSNLGLFGKKTTIGNEDVANMSFIEATVHGSMQ
jgi:hypothetical protein